MRGRTFAGLTAAVVVVGGIVTLAQDPPPEPDAIEIAAPQFAPEADDPMHAVEQFIESGRRQADQQIKTLTEERDRLRARLVKVETALQRWQAVSHALGRGADQAVEVLLEPAVPPDLPPPVPDTLTPARIGEDSDHLPTLVPSP